MKLSKLIFIDIRSSLKSRYYFALFIIIPLVLGLVIGYMFTWKRVPQEIPVAVWNRDHQELSREFIRFTDSTQAFRISQSVAGMEEGKALFISGKVRGFMIIPPDFTKQLKTGKQTQVVLYQDFNFILPGRTLAKGISKVESFEQDKWFRHFFEEKGISGGMADFLKNPIRIEYKKMFNPNMEYTQFMLPGILITFLFQILFLSGGSSMFSHNGIYRETSTARFLISRTISNLLLSLIPFTMLYLIMFPLFSLEMGNVFVFFIFYIIFALAVMFMGMLISALFNEPIMATEVIIGLGAVAFTLSGFTWPRFMFPVIYKYIVLLFPLTPFLDESTKIWYSTGYPLNPWLLIIHIFIYLIPLYFLTMKRRAKHVHAA